MGQADPVADRLRRAPVAPEVRADAWDVFQQAADPDDFARRISTLKLPDDVKADLWDIKAGVPLPEKPAPPREPGLATIGDQLAAKAQQHPHLRTARAVGDALQGIKAGALSTVYHGGDLVRRGWNALVPESMAAERVIERPEVQALITPPESLPGKIGFYGEQAAEFAVPLTRLSKATKGAGLLKRAGVDAAASAGVAGVQSGGDQSAMAIGAAGGAVVPFAGAAFRGAKRAAAGAREGGIGGAVAAAVRTVAPSEPTVMMTQALKPRSTQTKFTGSLAKALPEIKVTEAELGKPIENITDLLAATKAAKQRVRAQYDEIAGPKRAIGTEVDLSAVADAVEKRIPAKLKLEDPTAAQAILDRVAVYRRKFNLEEAEQLWMDTNAELEAFYNKYPIAQRKALRADPEAARLVAQGDALRDAIYKTLDNPGQPGIARELNRRYGALLDVENEATRRVNVAARQQPESLSEQIGAVRAAGDMARGAWRVAHGDLTGAADIASAAAQRSTAKYLKEQQTTDALIKRAIAGVTTKPGPIPKPVQRPVRGLLPRGPVVTPPGPDPSGPIPPTLPENYVREKAWLDEVVGPERAAAEVVPEERNFVLRWLADDLREISYQPSSRMRGAHALDAFEQAGSVEEGARATYAPRVAGTHTQEMFHAAGIKGTRSEIAERLDRYMQTGKGDARIAGIADALREAWDGRTFDWDLISDETLQRAGIRRRDLREPSSLPNAGDMPEMFTRFFGGGE